MRSLSLRQKWAKLRSCSSWCLTWSETISQMLTHILKALRWARDSPRRLLLELRAAKTQAVRVAILSTRGYDSQTNNKQHATANKLFWLTIVKRLQRTKHRRPRRSRCSSASGVSLMQRNRTKIRMERKISIRRTAIRFQMSKNYNLKVKRVTRSCKLNLKGAKICRSKSRAR